MSQKEATLEQNPEYHHYDEYQTRLQKLQEIKQAKVDPYPHKFDPEFSCASLTIEHDNEKGGSEDAETGSTPEVSVAGRIILFRAMGKKRLCSDSRRIGARSAHVQPR